MAWGDKAATCTGGSVLVWSAETWALERTLRGHAGTALSLAVSGRRLIGGLSDGTVRVWSTETWECVQTVEVYDPGSGRRISWLAVSGPALVGGSDFCRFSAAAEPPAAEEVRAWDLESLLPLHTLRLRRREGVESLVSFGRELWVATRDQVMVWGRRELR